MPAILVVLGRIILFCFGLGILINLIAHFREYKDAPLTHAERADVPWLLLGALLVIILLAVALVMIIAALTL